MCHRIRYLIKERMKWKKTNVLNVVPQRSAREDKYESRIFGYSANKNAKCKGNIVTIIDGSRLDTFPTGNLYEYNKNDTFNWIYSYCPSAIFD